mmetsp:Transcript_34920/g.56522  ORF Transcript_34920/g.56522 Transcript_34920/m.56522 type:complete len:367 (+) Transcript_34920:645-1745(+)|eukprot:CAMPEP_0184658400 /NCGR_PEP_ID=MMETSP0308-20130426/25238_1 /TAXON_ID=38269 /ORGANISM="Gloeochaete witrockiana, Strain SAG 46.84" /LENGTH=366 /DNA_ID=CAMNT_0027097353 /DNA_START=571 /DNA_END=1671 /DNA_ORIENTATION=+
MAPKRKTAAANDSGEAKGRKRTKKAEVDSDNEAEPEKKKPVKKSSRGKKAAKSSESEDHEEASEGEVAEKKPVPKKKAAPKKPAAKQATEEQEKVEEEPVPYGPAPEGQLKLVSWNVNGIRAILKKPDFMEYVEKEQPDVLCLQETKVSLADCPKDILTKLGYEEAWACGTEKKGYSGIAVFTKHKPLKITDGLGQLEHDGEGRLVTVEFDKFYLINTYVPNSGEALARLSYRTTSWDVALQKYMKELDEKKPVILTGDLNVAHEDIDIHSPSTNHKSAGFTDEERQSFSKLLDMGFVDSYRAQYPTKAHRYTYWGYRFNGRSKNKGWRLDYFVVSKRLMGDVKESFIRSNVLGSDHCPIGLLVAV